MKRFLKRTAFALAFVAAMDSAVFYTLSHPGIVAYAHPSFAVFARGIYLDGGRSIIQLEPDCARYDEELTYTLKPGRFVFSNAEFRTEYRVNSQGTRSEESRLAAPELIVLGDSCAMGWGVSQEAMYSEIIGRRTGLKTLNVSVSSYGTAREMKLLDRIDTSALRTLVIHYVENDHGENKYFYEHGNSLKITGRQKYEKIRDQYLKSKRYYPGKYTYFFFYRHLVEAWNRVLRFFGFDENKSDALYFLNALTAGGRTQIDGTRLIVLADGKFINRLRAEMRSGNYPAYVKGMTLVSDDVLKSGYFALDNHMNEHGHRALAARLARIVGVSTP